MKSKQSGEITLAVLGVIAAVTILAGGINAIHTNQTDQEEILAIDQANSTNQEK